MSDAFHRKCPLCGGDLLRSRSNTSGYTTYFWKKPWKTGLFAWGVVLFYLDRLPAVVEEYRSARNAGRAPEGYPATIKP
jgi:hypothetical protein